MSDRQTACAEGVHLFDQRVCLCGERTICAYCDRPVSDPPRTAAPGVCLWPWTHTKLKDERAGKPSSVISSSGPGVVRPWFFRGCTFGGPDSGIQKPPGGS